MIKGNFSVGTIIKIMSLIYASICIIAIIIFIISEPTGLLNSNPRYRQLNDTITGAESADSISDTSDTSENKEDLVKEMLFLEITYKLKVVFILLLGTIFTTSILYGFGEVVCRCISIDEKLSAGHKKSKNIKFDLE